MKYNGPCADTAGSAGEGLRKKGGTSMRKETKSFLSGRMHGSRSSGRMRKQRRETQVATADNATAASTSTGAADSAATDSAAPETAGEVDGQINLRAVAFWKQFRCAGYGMALDDGRVLRRTDA